MWDGPWVVLGRVGEWKSEMKCGRGRGFCGAEWGSGGVKWSVREAVGCVGQSEEVRE